jgi:hypothetical protein
MSSWGVGSWDPAAKVHMMTYEKKETLQRCITREQFFSLGRGGEDLDPHENSYESVCIFEHQINKEQLNGWYEYWKHKKDSIFIQRKPMS